MDEEGRRTSLSRNPAAQVARMQDVAKLAAVSTATVSRALASPDRVSADTRARVLKAIAQVGYVPNPAARTLRSQKTGMVLVVLPDLGQHFLFEDPVGDRRDIVRGRLRDDHRRSCRLARQGGAFRRLYGGRARLTALISAERAFVRAEPRGPRASPCGHLLSLSWRWVRSDTRARTFRRSRWTTAWRRKR